LLLYVTCCQTYGARHRRFATELNNLAGLLCLQGKYDEARSLHEQSLAIRRKALGEEHPDVATSLNNLAKLLETQGKYDEAKPLYHQSLTITQVLADEHPTVATLLNNLAGLLSSQDKYDEALIYVNQSLHIRRSKLGDTHPDTLSSIALVTQIQQRRAAVRHCCVIS
jgi:tetratricopeptide (TPR) repeat protein